MMALSRTLATALRVLSQLRHDHRSLAMMMLVPVLLLTLLRYIWIDDDLLFDSVGGALMCLFPFIVMFIITSVSTLRERQSGTLERLLAMPIGKADLILGYLLAFGLMAVVQSLLASVVAFGPLDLEVAGPRWAFTMVAVLLAWLGTASGLALSAFARTEFQAVQFMPAFVFPQLLLCGLIAPVESMGAVLEWTAELLPLTYAVRAFQNLMVESDVSADTWRSIAVVAGFMVGFVVAGAATLRRRTP